MSDPNNLVYREQLDDNVIDMLSEDIGSNYSLRTENTKTIASALNEIHGKDIIANVVGDPLLSTDSYNDMGNKIRELTVKLKNKLLSNGISIAEYDKLNSLIEKIEALEGSKEGGYNLAKQVYNGTKITANEIYDFKAVNIPINVDFTPVRIIMHSESLTIKDSPTMIKHCVLDSAHSNSEDTAACFADETGSVFNSYISDITQESFKIYIECYSGTPSGFTGNIEFTIIGDYSELEKALIDTLKKILINKGVTVTGNETLSELILKIDEIKSGSSIEIISATKLPTTGTDNQICVITDNPVDNFVTTSNFNDTSTASNDSITLYLGNTASSDMTEGTLLEVNQGNLISKYYFVKACQGENRLDSYYWLNNQWNRLTQSGIYLVENKVERNNKYFGGIPDGPGAEFNSNGLTLLYSYSTPRRNVTTKNTINFSLYNKLDITVRNPDTSNSYLVCVGYASTDHFASQGWYPTNDTGQTDYNNATDAYKQIQVTRGQTVSQTIDISSWTGMGWLFLATYNGTTELYITDLKLY